MKYLTKKKNIFSAFLMYEWLNIKKRKMITFFKFVFPFLWLLMTGYMWQNFKIYGNVSFIDYFLPSLLILLALTLTLKSISSNLVVSRQLKLLKQFGIGGGTKLDYIGFTFTYNLILYLILSAIMILLDFALFHLTMNINTFYMYLANILIYISFFFLSILLGSVFNNYRTAADVILIIFFLFMFTSGSTIPAYFAGHWFSYIQKITPAGNGIILLQQILLHQNINSDLFPLLYLVLFNVTITPLAIYKFSYI